MTFGERLAKSMRLCQQTTLGKEHNAGVGGQPSAQEAGDMAILGVDFGRSNSAVGIRVDGAAMTAIVEGLFLATGQADK